MAAIVTVNFRRWSEADDAFLRTHAHRGLIWLCENLGRTEIALYCRASRLKIKIPHVLEYDSNASLIVLKTWIWNKRILPSLTQNGTCLEWHGANKLGYGQIRFFVGIIKRIFFTHRIALEVQMQCELGKGFGALHTCDNPKCCNPAHLYPGTQLDNVADMMSRNRGRGQFQKGHGKVA